MSGNVPAIRFAGFTEPWEQRKLGDMGTAYGGLSGKSKEDFGHGEAWFVPYTNVFDNPIGDPSRLARVEIDPGQNVVRRGDALFTVSSETPEEVGMSCVWPSDLGNLYLNSFCFGYRQDGSFDSNYLAYMLRSGSFRGQVEMLAQGISRFNISKGKVMEVEVPVPDKAEQAMIGRLFVDLDNLITLHQRKHDQLATLKKSLLDKMFPKPGSDVPELRFAGFAEPWEQRKLNQFVSVTSEKNLDGTFAREDVLSVSRDLGVVNQIEFQGRSFAGADVSVYGILRHGDIVYTKSPLRANPYGIIKTNKGRSGIVSTLYATYRARPGVDPDFVQCYFDQDARLNNYLHPLVNKGAKNDMKVSAGNAITGDVCFPEYEEQRLIAMLFDRLDNLITLHQRKHDQLATLKKSLLDKMFV